MKKQRLLLLFLVLNICFVAQSQTTTTIDNKVILKSYTDSRYIYPFIFQDYDNRDNLWFSLATDTSFGLYQVDNNLNIIKSIVNQRWNVSSFKLNNKLYGTRNFISLNNIYERILDSIYFYENDTNGNTINSKLIFSNAEHPYKYYKVHTCFVTQDKNIAILLSTLDTNNDKYKELIIIDTLGERKASKLLDQIPYQDAIMRIYESDSNFIMNKTNNVYGTIKGTKVYYINKNSLDIIDSVSFDTAFFNDNLKKINDSIIITISQYGAKPSNEPARYFINIVNDKKREIISRIKVEYGGAFVSDGFLPDYQERVDFRNQDSIYYCCFVRNSEGVYDSDYSGFIQIVNFGIDGDLNFDYRFRYDSVSPKQINGVKATADGGLLVAVQVTISDCWIMKFMPNGVVGLTNIETGDKESIKVYPNPAKDYINVDIECTNFKASDIELFDMQGRLVKKEKLKSKLGNRIGVSNLNAGAYTYNVSLNGKTISGKVIIGK